MGERVMTDRSTTGGAADGGLAELEALARQAGIAVQWTDAYGRPRAVSPETLRGVLHGLGIDCAGPAEIAMSRAALARPAALPPLLTADAGGSLAPPLPQGGALPEAELALPEATLRLEWQPGPAGPVLRLPDRPGYHRLRLGAVETLLALAPARAPGLAALAGRPRAYGVAVQLHALRQPGDGGIGDAGGLRAALRALAAEGATALALGPTHALFAASPDRANPYAPSNRLALNPLLADPAPRFGPAAMQAAWDTAAPAERRAAWEGAALIDWPAAGAARQAMLRLLFAALPAHPEIAAAFAAWRRNAAPALAEHALFEALHRHHAARGDPWDWRGWRLGLRRPDGREVAAFAAEHAAEVDFHLFAQFLAAESLAAAQATAREAGMGIGLVADLALGMDLAGSQAWANPAGLLGGLTIGAAPDRLSSDGQGWGLTGFSPTALRASGFAPFLAMLRATLRHAGGIRLAHAAGLSRVWLVPDGARPAEGAYVEMPQADLLRLVVLEAHLHGALAIGADLGTVPEGLNQAMAARGLLGLRVLPFERDPRGRLLPPDAWPADAVAMTSTHDIVPMAGWWRGIDLAWQDRLRGTRPDPSAQAARKADRGAFWQVARGARLVSGPLPPPYRPRPAVDGAIAWVAAAPAALALVPVEDLLGLEEAPNLPGTADRHPNWRRRLPEPLPEALARKEVADRLATLRER